MELDLTDAELSSMIVNGKPGGTSATAHKSKALTPEQIEDVIGTRSEAEGPPPRRRRCNEL